VILLGDNDVKGTRGLGGSEYLCRKLGKLVGDAPLIDLAAEVRLQKLVLELARAHLLESAHDVSDGGLVVALAECCVAGASGARSGAVPELHGARIDLDARSQPAEVVALLFGESPSRVVVSVRPDAVGRVVAMAKEARVHLAELGVTGGSSLSIALVPREGAVAKVGTVVIEVEQIRARRDACLEAIVGR
jgi:phosphoribosylformylglycinamidine synthase